ncbi:MAG: hypothetical protein CM1200mP39_14040 [Dehalococcoidia bacterium]|nr:MAG: hypothetical protein CM1200mP39_14040 [Dehalococcoidia bacterium]
MPGEFSEITGVDISLAESAESLVRESDIVTLITSATEPIVNSSWWKPGTHINGVGSHAPGIRELDTATGANGKGYLRSDAGLLERGRRYPNSR